MKNVTLDKNTGMRNRSLGFSLGLTAAVFLATAVCQARPPALKVAASSPAAKARQVYKCPDCQDKFTEAQAKKVGMKCTCCQTKLVRIKQAKTIPAAKPGGKKG